MQYLISAAMIVLSAVAAAAQTGDPGGIQVEHVWARAMPKGTANAVAYLTIVNSGTQADRLIAVSTPVGEAAQIHEATSNNGVASMRQLEAVDIPPGSQVSLKPGGIHLMLLHVTQQLKEGDTFPLTLTFEKAGAIETTVKVGKVGAVDDMSGM